MDVPALLFLGLKGHVVALDKASGREVWRTKLPAGFTVGDRFVTLLVEDQVVFAHTHGALHALDAANGTLKWTNELKGLGYDLSSLATANASTDIAPLARKKRLGSGGSGGSGDGGGGGD